MPCIIKIIIFNNEINKVFLNVLTKISIGLTTSYCQFSYLALELAKDSNESPPLLPRPLACLSL
jgi:hypothetical protein